jgi:hypothetical protein
MHGSDTRHLASWMIEPGTRPPKSSGLYCYRQDRYIDFILDFDPDPAFDQMFEEIDTEEVIPGILPLHKAVVFIMIFRRNTWPPWHKTEAFHQLIEARMARDGSNSLEVQVYNICLHSYLPMSDVGVIGLWRASIRLRPERAVSPNHP